MRLVYARVSPGAQKTHLQKDALKCAECTRVYQEKAPRAETKRPELIVGRPTRVQHPNAVRFPA